MVVAKTPLIISHPAIAADWHPTANGPKTPENVSPHSKFEATWLCHGEPRHEIKQRVDHRVASGGCRACIAEKNLAENNLAFKFPRIAKEWHPTKNGDLTPKAVHPMSHKRIWWQCSKDPSHVWQAYLHLRTSKDTGCPKCPPAPRRPDKVDSLAYRNPAVAAQWHPTKNEGLRPEEVFWASNKRFWWQCSQGHAWSALVLARTSLKTGCPYCAEYYLTDKDRLSVQYPEIAAEWHPTKNRRLWPKIEGGFKVAYNRRLDPSQRDYESNRRLSPSDVSILSQEEIWWQCRKSIEHVWQSTVQARTKKKETCPFCSGSKACSDNNLAVMYPGLARQWQQSRNASLLPTQVTPVSNKTVWWRCVKNAGHTYQGKIADVVAAYENGNSFCTLCRAIKPDSSGHQQKSG